MILKINEKGEIVGEFKSLAKAGKSVGGYHHSISRAIEAERKYAGFYWKYSDKEPIESINQNSINMNIEQSEGISLRDFRLKNDVRFMVCEGVKKLTKDKMFLTVDFMNLCGISPNVSTRRIEEYPEYDSYHGRCAGKVYWSHPETINQFKKEHVLV
jgi:hypothetical protein